MRLVFVLCTTLTFMQIFGISIAQSQAKENANSKTQTKPKDVIDSTKKPQTPLNLKSQLAPTDNKLNTQNPARKSIPAPLKKQQEPKTPEGLQRPPNPKPTVVHKIAARGLNENNKKQSENNEQETLSDEEIQGINNSVESELPSTDPIQSGTVLAKTLTRQASRGGSGLFNSLTRFVNSACDTFGFFAGLIRKRSNPNTAIRYAGDTLSRGTEFASNTLVDTLKSTRKIGREGSRQFSKILNSVQELGENLTKLGGTAASSTVGIGTKLAKLSNNVLLRSNKSFNNIIPKLPENEADSQEKSSNEEQPREVEKKKVPVKETEKSSKKK